MKRALLAAALLSGCATVPTEMRVAIAPTSYTAAMSSTIGVGLEPSALPPRGVKVRYRWSTNHGRFLSWSENTHEITERGPQTMTESGGKLYWAYVPSDPAAIARKPVTVVILAEDMADGKVLARTDVHLVWEDGGIVRVVH